MAIEELSDLCEDVRLRFGRVDMMKKLLILFFAFALAWPGISTAQTKHRQNSKNVAVPDSVQLSSYMRDVALLYIEGIEHGVGIMTDSNIPWDSRFELSEQQFKFLDSLDARIEIHTQYQADKNFHSLFLQKLRDLAELDVTFTQQAYLSPDRQRLEERKRDAETATRDYLHCNSDLRAIIRAGDYSLNKLVAEEYCKQDATLKAKVAAQAERALREAGVPQRQ
jgi:hypothetical protein